MSSLDRVEEIKKTAISARLMKGAEILGDLRRRGLLCSAGWSAACPCTPPSDFCLAKAKWAALYADLHEGEDVSGLFSEYGVIEAMTVRQWHATKLTALVEVPFSKKPIRVGPRGTTWKTLVDLAALVDTADYAAALQSVLKLQGALR